MGGGHGGRQEKEESSLHFLIIIPPPRIALGWICFDRWLAKGGANNLGQQ